MKKLIFIFVLCILYNCNTSKSSSKIMGNKIVVAHRGASGYLPEHTMEAKAMAHAMNPDYIEQDLVLSKDDVPVVIHDIYLDDVTNAYEVFPDRKRADNRYYVIDFTFDELQQLQVTERFNPKTGKQFYSNRFPKGKGNFKLHSLQQEIELIQGLNYSTGKNIGIYPEIKNPEFHHTNGKDIAKITLDVLREYGYKTKSDKCIFQCFDAKELERVRKELNSNLFLVQLIEFEEETKRLKHFATYADGIGPWYKQIISKKVDGKFAFTSLVERSHKYGLKVHPYTFRADQLDEFSSFDEMIHVLLIDANVDGGFTDFPDKMVAFLFKQ
ncbi:glycerophosphodiester phosphodiesterase [Tenacibaculum holothuriorum]|uniref:glycerophosphodiester phosphodiesterase n=1 Tax=Tenacibaculum holothuriorum TaxID=1635173 RepID=A0A1Y2PFE0_9FLAO|nr:glycerophosphodiester phosphodiesterase [Tenacibaculum holothuriorum]OSY88890.1 glycerophosphodiester phosphodiesterase [Tenacibaculum holothuriorum]